MRGLRDFGFYDSSHAVTGRRIWVIKAPVAVIASLTPPPE